MKILHTSDWHVGKRLMGRERLQEQAEALDEIVNICEREQIELVLLAGDVYDTYTPSAEAEQLFYAKIKRIAGNNRAVFLISGNHDDGVRLSAVSPLSGEHGIYVMGNNRYVSLSNTGDRGTRAVQTGAGWIVFENRAGEQVFVGALPYPNEARFKEEKSDLPYVQRMQGWIQESMQGNANNLPSVFMAHLFVAGGAVSDSEREIDLGGARAIPIEALPKADYIALGHLHKKQKMGKGNCYYSGSPLQYSFDESADKSVKIFTLDKNGVQNLQDVPLTKGKKLIRLQAENVDDALTLLQSYPENLVEMKLLLSAPLTSADSARRQKESARPYPSGGYGRFHGQGCRPAPCGHSLRDPWERRSRVETDRRYRENPLRQKQSAVSGGESPLCGLHGWTARVFWLCA
jgi:exonuclease SbcD